MNNEDGNLEGPETLVSPDIIEELVITFRKEGSLVSKVYGLLKDRRWHCRNCEGNLINPRQYAGGGGIQGLQRGNRFRPGLVIEPSRQYCPTCRSDQDGDRWTGAVRRANAPANISPALVERILTLYNYTDVIEQRQRQRHELVIDHRFPMERWGNVEPPNSATMTDEEIHRKFQVLKKDEGGNHNLLKSRACENCIRNGKRGEPFGIPFWYYGAENWPADVPQRGMEAEQGCVGCGWYDFDAWRQALRRVAPLLNALNQEITESGERQP